MPNGRLLITLSFAVPGSSLTRVEMFLRDLDELGVKWSATMDSHPSDAVLAALPERIREQLVQDQ